MHACELLLDELRALIPVEERALAAEDLDKAVELAERRQSLLRQVWEEREGFDREELKRRLEDLREKQGMLNESALALQKSLQERQRDGRKQTRYLNGDRYIRSQSQRAFYCRKVT